jgi:outer membrane protein
VLAAQDTLSFVRAQRAAVDEQLASAKRNFELGTATVTDSLEAQARHDLVAAQELAADNDLRVKQLALDALVGRAETNPVPLAPRAALPAPQPANMDAWIGLAEQNSPAVRQARVNIELAQLETEKAKAGGLPTVDLVASYGITRNPGGNATVAGTTRNDLATIGLSLNLPLFAGFAVQNRIRETLALEDKAQADLDATDRLVAQAVRTAYLGVLSGRSQVKALEAAEASTQSALEANELGYQVGVRINIDVLNAQSQLYQTKRDLAQARYAAVLGDLKLRQAAGTLSPADLGRLDALLAK